MTEKDLLTVKRFNLSQMRSTIRPDLGVQTSKSSGFQFDTPQPLPAYPAPGAGPIVINTFRVPAAMTGKITYMTLVDIGGAFVQGSGDLLWHIFRNGAPIKGFENIYVEIGTIANPSDVGILLLQNDLIQILVEVPAGHVAPAGGSPFSRVSGFFDYGGAGTSVARSGGVGGAPGSSGAVAASSTTTSTTTSTSTSSGTSSGTGSGSGTGTGGTSGCPYNGAPAVLLGNRSKWTVEQVPNDEFVYIRTDTGREGWFSLTDVKYTRRGWVRITHLRPGFDRMITIDGEELLVAKQFVRIPGATVDKYEYSDVDGHVYFAYGFMGHNSKTSQY